MAYVCEVLQQVNNVQTCVSWVLYTEPDFFKSVAIDGEQARSLYKAFSVFCGLCIAYVFTAKSLKLL